MGSICTPRVHLADPVQELFQLGLARRTLGQKTSAKGLRGVDRGTLTGAYDVLDTYRHEWSHVGVGASPIPVGRTLILTVAPFLSLWAEP